MRRRRKNPEPFTIALLVGGALAVTTAGVFVAKKLKDLERGTGGTLVARAPTAGTAAFDQPVIDDVQAAAQAAGVTVAELNEGAVGMGIPRDAQPSPAAVFVAMGPSPREIQDAVAQLRL